MAWTTPITAVTNAIATAAQWNASLRDNLLFLKGDTGWTAPTLVNSWANYGGGNANAGYRRVGDWVVVRGVVKDGTVPATIFTLPIGYRPDSTHIFASTGAAAYGTLSVESNGVVACVGGSNAYFSIFCQFIA